VSSDGIVLRGGVFGQGSNPKRRDHKTATFDRVMFFLPGASFVFALAAAVACGWGGLSVPDSNSIVPKGTTNSTIKAV